MSAPTQQIHHPKCVSCMLIFIGARPTRQLGVEPPWLLWPKTKSTSTLQENKENKEMETLHTSPALGKGLKASQAAEQKNRTWWKTSTPDSARGNDMQTISTQRSLSTRTQKQESSSPAAPWHHYNSWHWTREAEWKVARHNIEKSFSRANQAWAWMERLAVVASFPIPAWAGLSRATAHLKDSFCRRTCVPPTIHFARDMDLVSQLRWGSRGTLQHEREESRMLKDVPKTLAHEDY